MLGVEFKSGANRDDPDLYSLLMLVLFRISLWPRVVRVNVIVEVRSVVQECAALAA